MASNPDEYKKEVDIPLQRKTTLKWSSNGELSEIDMARIISRLNNSDLTSCTIQEESEDN
tara:strand:+ start:5044 stop:5223 length:180 start_codon:yes stop_codon:yes gene_type:complete